MLDTLVRIALAWASRRCGSKARREAVARLRWLVVVPARGEGRSVEPTVRSLLAAAEGHAVRIVVLMDGPDAQDRDLLP
ncbi:MAG: hypothetical protein AB2L07_00665 [Thermoanaerobaculaceae bacterium]